MSSGLLASLRDDGMAVISHHSISLDGFVAGVDDAMDWVGEFGRPTSLADDTLYRVGAIVAGRRWYDRAHDRWDGVDGIYGGKFDGRVFVVTHNAPDQAWDARVSFAPDVAQGVAAAQAAAGEKDVGIFGGSLTQQCLALGLLDEIVLHLVPVVLGSGVRLFGTDGPRVELERISAAESDQLTDLHFRVLKGAP